ncbi:hypothetical protein P4O66_021976 [Electrophorus voltai]|uniref:Uncharacterized protein n=1 Tax=Electrophorus voltai TaxID=2609070 RepID=A0AAD9E2U8_9TELE|nr:hypothetical protein P4O66_021976 [Electrophorus voltai]
MSCNMKTEEHMALEAASTMGHVSEGEQGRDNEAHLSICSSIFESLHCQTSNFLQNEGVLCRTPYPCKIPTCAGHPTHVRFLPVQDTLPRTPYPCKISYLCRTPYPCKIPTCAGHPTQVRFLPVQDTLPMWLLYKTLDMTEWEMVRCSSDDLSKFTEAVVGFLGKLVDDTVHKTTIRTFNNQKLWVDKTIYVTLKSHTAAYNIRLTTTGNIDKYKAASDSLCRVVKAVKRRYGRKWKAQIQQFDSRSLWQELRSIMDYKPSPTRMVNADVSLAEELNVCYACSMAAASRINVCTHNGARHGEQHEESIQERRSQAVQVGRHSLSSLTLSTGAPHRVCPEPPAVLTVRILPPLSNLLMTLLWCNGDFNVNEAAIHTCSYSQATLGRSVSRPIP